METIIPWKELTTAIEPLYPKPEGAGRMNNKHKEDKKWSKH